MSIIGEVVTIVTGTIEGPFSIFAHLVASTVGISTLVDIITCHVVTMETVAMVTLAHWHSAHTFIVVLTVVVRITRWGGRWLGDN